MPLAHVIFWNKSGDMTGHVFERGADKVGLTEKGSHSAAENSNFVERLREVNTALSEYSGDSIILSGCLPQTICLELALPPMKNSELADVLAFELPRILPSPVEYLAFFFRRVENAVRICAMKRAIWEQFLADCSSAGVRFDAYIHPFMVADDGALLGGYRWQRDAVTGLCSMVAEEADETDGEFAESLAKYSFSPGFAGDCRYLSPIPQALKPQRFRTHRLALAALLGFCVVIGGALGYRHWQDNRGYERAIYADIDQATYIAELYGREITGMQARSEAVQKLLWEANEIAPLPLLEELTAALPNRAWVTGFRTGGGIVNLTAVSSERAEAVTSVFNGLDGFEVESLRQQIGGDGKTTLFVTMRSK